MTANEKRFCVLVVKANGTTARIPDTDGRYLMHTLEKATQSAEMCNNIYHDKTFIVAEDISEKMA